MKRQKRIRNNVGQDKKREDKMRGWRKGETSRVIKREESPLGSAKTIPCEPPSLNHSILICKMDGQTGLVDF